MSEQNNSNFLRDKVLKENTEFELYALQLANMIRIRNNDFVCIFDEVGTGKTISAGLCIIELLNSLEEDQKLKVLIITKNSVLESFKDKLQNKLLLLHIKDITDIENENKNENEEKYSIILINDNYSKIGKVAKKYDLVIIDEADTFLTKDTSKRKKLDGIAANKVIFLTATPIKSGKSDIEEYINIAGGMLERAGKKIDINQLLDRFLWELADPKLLSTSFNPYSPITRYFKDVTRNIIIKNGKVDKNDKQPIRLVPEVWDVGDYNKDENNINRMNRIEYLVYKIKDIPKYKEYGKEKYENRFIIFIDKKEQGEKIVKELIKNNFYKWSKKEKSSEKTYYKLVGGKNQNPDLIDFMSSNKDANLPTVIITTWQMSEVGVDFPGYNYIVNYHINRSPAKIEQRFGRIDRMDSLHKELKMCFVINSRQYTEKERKEDKCSTNNFYNAMDLYIRELLTFLPSKNSLITEETPDLLLDKYNKKREDYKKIKEKFNDDEFINQINERLDNPNNNLYCEDIINIINEFSLKKKENPISSEKLMKKINRRINRLDITIQNINKLKENLQDISNKVIFNDNLFEDEEDLCEDKGEYNIQKIDSEECYKSIMESKRFKFFKNKIIDLLR